MSHNKRRRRRATGHMTATDVDPRDRAAAPARRDEQAIEAHEPPREESATRGEIARRAYEIYLARGGGEGRDVEDWLSAEAEVLARGAGR
jgi:hypothetical protein